MQVDSEGFLKDYKDWQPAYAPELARAEGITLSDAHWEIIDLVRAYYDQYHVSPTTRVLAKLVANQLGADKGKSIYLMQLFSSKAAKLVAKIAGLPKPANCD